MKVIIVSPEKTIYAGEANAVHLPGAKGSFEVLTHHAPIITTLTEGTVRVSKAEPLNVSISGGFAEVSRDEATICVEESHNV